MRIPDSFYDTPELNSAIDWIKDNGYVQIRNYYPSDDTSKNFALQVFGNGSSRFSQVWLSHLRIKCMRLGIPCGFTESHFNSICPHETYWFGT